MRKQKGNSEKKAYVVNHAGGGDGHFAIQIAKNIGAAVVATSSAKNRDFLLSIGAMTKVAKSSMPSPGCIGPCVIANVLLTIAGSIILFFKGV